MASSFGTNGMGGLGYALYPLVDPAGPDGAYDIYQGGKTAAGVSTPYQLTSGYLDPYAKVGGYYVGQPVQLDATLNVMGFMSGSTYYLPGHLDNIHNHRLELH